MTTSHHRFTKQPDLSECSREYLEALADRLELRQLAGEAIDTDWLAQVRAAIPNAPAYFILHRAD